MIDLGACFFSRIYTVFSVSGLQSKKIMIRMYNTLINIGFIKNLTI